MRCENCGAYASRAAAYCPSCGVELRNLRLPVKRQPSSPAVWRRAAPVIARGVALVALGVVAEAALNALARGVIGLPAARRAAKSRPLPARRQELPQGSYVVSETVVMRRLTVRR